MSGILYSHDGCRLYFKGNPSRPRFFVSEKTDVLRRMRIGYDQSMDIHTLKGDVFTQFVKLCLDSAKEMSLAGYFETEL